jgi:cyclophilin family peptidyl-prolyl cis-trans isomerase
MHLRLLLLFALALGQAAPFKTPYPLEEMRNKQAVVETDLGTFVIQLLPDAAPNHVGHFMKLAREGAYAGTTFHRVIRYGIIQGGDPLTKDPSKAAAYGTGGLGKLKRELSAEKHTAGAVAAVLIPNKPDSGGDQFFVDVTDQPALDGQYTIFGRVVEGIEVTQAISAVDADAEGRPSKRVVIRSVTIRDTPPAVVPRFSTETAAELAAYRATLDTTLGEIEIQFLTDLAPEHARNFLQLADAGVYDDVLVHRVVKGFVVQTGAIAYRTAPLTPAQQKLVHNLQPEFSNTPNLPGIVSMARGEDPASATTSFFICIGECRTLDGKYTVFAKVTRGLEVLKAMEAVEVDGETPKAPIMVRRVTIR